MAMPDLDLMNDEMVYNIGRVYGQRGGSPMSCQETGVTLIIWMTGYVQGCRDVLHEILLADQRGHHNIPKEEQRRQAYGPDNSPAYAVDPRRYPMR